jgi:predicted transcriptional regulator
MKKSVRHLPRWQIVARLKAARIRQADIAHMADVSQALVCRVIARDVSDSETTERVWKVLEDVLETKAS